MMRFLLKFRHNNEEKKSILSTTARLLGKFQAPYFFSYLLPATLSAKHLSQVT